MHNLDPCTASASGMILALNLPHVTVRRTPASSPGGTRLQNLMWSCSITFTGLIMSKSTLHHITSESNEIEYDHIRIKCCCTWFHIQQKSLLIKCFFSKSDYLSWRFRYRIFTTHQNQMMLYMITHLTNLKLLHHAFHTTANNAIQMQCNTNYSINQMDLYDCIWLYRIV